MEAMKIVSVCLVNSFPAPLASMTMNLGDTRQRVHMLSLDLPALDARGRERGWLQMAPIQVISLSVRARAAAKLANNQPEWLQRHRGHLIKPETATQGAWGHNGRALMANNCKSRGQKAARMSRPCCALAGPVRDGTGRPSWRRLDG